MSAELIEAVKAGNTAEAQRMLAAGADVNSRDAEGATLLMLAAHAGNLAMTKVLVEAYPHRMMNIHPSLLPSFKGLHTHRQALDMVLTNSLAATDVAAVHGGYAHYRKNLLENGVRLFELYELGEDLNERISEERKEAA